MIDWHSHILAGLDDGSSDLEQSLTMAGQLSQAGFTTVYCTPHLMRGCFEATNEQVRQGVAELQQLVTAHALPLTLLPGREYYLDEFLPQALQDPLPLGDSRMILVELPATIDPELARQLLYGVVRGGFTPVIAHPERCPLLWPVQQQHDRRNLWSSISHLMTGERRLPPPCPTTASSGNPLLEYLRDLGCSFQGDLGSFNALYGRQVQVAAETLRRLGIYDRYGSDLHAPQQASHILKSFSE